MNTDLNNEVKQFFSKYKLREINISNIKKHFKNIFQENEYGSLLHAAVHNKYSIDKVLKFIEVLLENKVNPNLKGKLTGYSFIHLALYGYTDNNEDFSYSTDFIVELINLAKQYNFDVNIKDHDSDSIIHTALASEIYTGEIIPLINALGKGFDINCKDNNNHNIYQALLEYKEEAQDDSNSEWLNKLIKEEEAIKKLIEIYYNNVEKNSAEEDNSNKNNTQENNSDEDDENLRSLQNEIEILKSKTDLQYLQENYQTIIELLKKSNTLINIKEASTRKKDQEFKNTITNYLNLIKKILRDSLEQIATNPNIKKIDNLSKLIKAFDFNDLNNDLLTIKDEYLKRIAEFKESIENAQTLTRIEELEKELSFFNEEKIKDELKELLEGKSNKFSSLIDKIHRNYTTIEITYSCLEKESPENSQLNKKDNLENMTIKELEDLNLSLYKTLFDNNNLIKQSITNKMNKMLELIDILDNLDTPYPFEENELLDLISNIISEKVQSNQKKERSLWKLS